MKEYNELTIKQKAKLLDKLIYHAETIEKNILFILKPEIFDKAKEHSEYFLKIVKKELTKKVSEVGK
jgi:hypothetical protein